MQLTIRATTVELPDLEDVASLHEVDTLDAGASTTCFTFGGRLRQLDLGGQQLLVGRITGLRLDRGTWNEVRMDTVELSGCDLSSLALSNSKLTRVRFTNCKLLGAQFSDLHVENLVFDRCRLDYATLTGVTARGPVIFRDCTLASATLAGCDLSHTLLDQCVLAGTEFVNGTYRGMDLRGNDLSAVERVWNLRHIVIDRSQEYELAVALAAGLEVTYGSELEEAERREAAQGHR
jgi:uncharacterized protein YjbI with pentapeptide repeats